MRRVAVEFVHMPVPLLPGRWTGRCRQRVTHCGEMRVHLLGLARSQFVNDLLSDRYNHAALVEYVERRHGLMTVFSMN